MPRTGTLRSWNDDRGFGFVAPTDGGPEVFVHISAFPRDGSRPVVGEKLSFELGRGPDGKPRATNVVRLAVGRDMPRRQHAASSRTPLPSSTNWLGVLLPLVLLGIAGYYGYKRFANSTERRTLANLPATTQVEPDDREAPSPFHCDGRTRCSQMTSCAEATWFINHCPGTEMDGNHDGVPCEQQWCTSPFAK